MAATYSFGSVSAMASAGMVKDRAVDRTRLLNRAASERFDLLVIGGGITGVGVAREAALAGLNVAVFDRADFAAGTSSRSTKLIHGGLRYLRNYELRLVHESVVERQRLLRM